MSAANMDADEEVYEVQALLNHRMSKLKPGIVEYLIKWENYDESWNTWEREYNIFSEDLIDKYWKKQRETRSDFIARHTPGTSNDDKGSDRSKRKDAKKKKSNRREKATQSENAKAQTEEKKAKRIPQEKASRGDTKRKTRSQVRTNDDVTQAIQVKVKDDRTQASTPEYQIELPMDTPPLNLSWKDAKSVNHVYADADGVLFAKVAWSNGTSTFIPTKILRHYCPVLLLRFYENLLSFSTD
ncbi:uncharacterized protein BYT42DRAFT_642934 [Radiomyces spectabilis]|uniref:uncharacterized protein n=1 Tax=Radiomyces spectabilis TaxID=64574 RepID=UPI0022210E81|nr:uncharacterized protein BYT42DRAFT_642934 [Radiomyces spectabilis]KAI8388777.1 hypothetical protein BYT42DRAFT_642934 [Radiomyces spectabilis]